MAGMKDGIIKRGSTYSYVVREADPATGLTKPRWHGGFKARIEAVEARDQARVAARRGDHVTNTRETLAEYLRAWLRTVDVKPKTLSGYRYNVEHYVIPRLSGTRLQELRPAALTSLYADLRAHGGGRVLPSAGDRSRPFTER